MAGITLQIAQVKLQGWLDAEDKLQQAQSVTHNGRVLTRADLAEVRNSIDYWERKYTALSRGTGVGINRVVLHG